MPDGLRYYILRGNVMVPLVPVDQLPFQLEGVPRQLSHRQMSDECWKLLKETEHVATSLAIRKPLITSTYQHAPAAKSRFLAPDHQVRLELTAETEQSQPTDQRTLLQKAAPPALDPRNISPPGVHKSLDSLTDTFASIYHKDAQRFGYRMPYPSGIEPDPSKKEFCTHWIKTGECAFISVGCKYKHEMPTTEKLRGLGFTQLPRWWKEKSAVTTRGPTWMQRRLAAGNEDSEDGGDASDPRTFPDPSTFTNRLSDGKRFQVRETSPPTHLHQPSVNDSAITPRPPTPIAHPNEMNFRHISQVSNLLIDLDEAPTVPLSPQLSDRFLTSTSSVDIKPS
ncbi:hypothetical protein BDU57DRAFT_403084, partial [Ampelomyces quisqualis]